jgi:hypothetical protein
MADVKTSKVNYTEAMVEQMLAMYTELGNEGIEHIAQTLARPVRSVRSKLVREGVYVAVEKAVKAKREEGPTKKELLNQLESLVDFEVNGLMGATKEAIAHVIALARLHGESAADDESDEDETESAAESV